MLRYKNELNKDYPELVINSLLSMVYKLAEDGVIDVDTHYAVKEKSVSKESLRGLFLDKSTFLKTHEELFAEYEDIEIKLMKNVEMDDKEPNESL